MRTWRPMHAAVGCTAIPVNKPAFMLAKNKILSPFMQLIITYFTINTHNKLLVEPVYKDSFGTQPMFSHTKNPITLIRIRDHLNYVDCIGYLFSIHNRIRFLTGDIKFENKEHTEYVK